MKVYVRRSPATYDVGDSVQAVEYQERLAVVGSLRTLGYDRAQIRLIDPVVSDDPPLGELCVRTTFSFKMFESLAEKQTCLPLTPSSGSVMTFASFRSRCTWDGWRAETDTLPPEFFKVHFRSDRLRISAAASAAPEARVSKGNSIALRG